MWRFLIYSLNFSQYSWILILLGWLNQPLFAQRLAIPYAIAHQTAFEWYLNFFVPTDPIITITVNPANSGSTPQIIPVGNFYTVRVCTGTSIRLEAASSGIGTLTYEWIDVITGNTVGTGSIITQQLPESQYAVRIKDNNGTIQSSTIIQVCLSNGPPIDANISTSGSTTLCSSGSPTNLILTANASEPVVSIFCPMPDFKYQWLKDNIEIPSAINKTLTVSNNLSNAGTYSVKITNACGTVTASKTISIVNTAPTNVLISSQDGTNTICAGGTIQLNASALGQVDNFQWFRIGNPNPISTNSSIMLNSSEIGNYRVRAINGCGASDSPIFNVIVTSAPTKVNIVSSPDDGVACEGSVVILAPSDLEGGTPERFEWYKDNQLVITYDFPFPSGIDYEANENGNYHVKVINKCGSITSAEKAVVLVSTPTLVQVVPDGPPSLTTNCTPPRTSVLLQAVSNATNLTYEWYKNNTLLDGETNATYTATEAADYAVVVSNPCGIIGSDILTVTEVNSTLPTDIVLNNGGINNSCTGTIDLSTDDFGQGTLYEWRKDGVLVANTSTPHFQALESGTYTVKAANACGTSNESVGLSLIINLSPNLLEIQSPFGTTSCDVNTLIPLNVKPPTRSDLNYQWYKDGQPIPGGVGIGYNATDSGIYTVGASNVCGEEISAPITLRYLTPPIASDVQIVSNVCESPLVLSVQTSANELSYRWFFLDGMTNPIVGTNPTLQPTVSGAYVVSVRNECLPADVWVSSQPFNVDLNTPPLPNPVIVSVPSNIDRICPNANITLKANISTTFTDIGYRWFKGTQLMPNASTETINVSESGLYSVEVFSESVGNCSKVSLPYSVFVRPIPTLLISYNGSLEFCEGDSVRLNVNSQATPSEYKWYRDDVFLTTGNNLTAKLAGTYKVEASYNSGTLAFPCDLIAERTIQILTSPSPNPQIELEGGLLKSLTQGLTYQWNFNGIPILNANNPTYLPLDSGKYSVTITNDLGCSGTSEEISSKGIYLNVNPPISVSPNPNNGTFSITIISEDVTQIALYNLLGQQILSERELLKNNSIASHTKLQVFDLPNGMYLLKAKIKNQFVSQKIIVWR